MRGLHGTQLGHEFHIEMQPSLKVDVPEWLKLLSGKCPRAAMLRSPTPPVEWHWHSEGHIPPRAQASGCRQETVG